ncbi:MAG TPA: HEAT repeat domain-containing protein [Planctomycetota bacterium]
MMLLIMVLVMQDDPSVAALETFKADYKSKDPSVRAQAVTALSSTQHDKVYARLGQLLTVDDKDVRIAAAKGLGGCSAEKKTKPLTYLLGATAPNLKEPMVLAAILEALGKLRQEAALPEVEKHYRSKQIVVAQAAIQAAADIKSPRSVPGLINLLKWLDDAAQEAPSLDGGSNVPGVGGGGVQDQGAVERQRTLTPVVNKSLQAITGSAMNGRLAWENWFRETGGRVKPPK